MTGTITPEAIAAALDDAARVMRARRGTVAPDRAEAALMAWRWLDLVPDDIDRKIVQARASGIGWPAIAKALGAGAGYVQRRHAAAIALITRQLADAMAVR